MLGASLAGTLVQLKLWIAFGLGVVAGALLLLGLALAYAGDGLMS